MKGIWTYDAGLPSIPEDSRLSLGEGHTPLLHSRRLGPALGLKELYLKLEITNPTGSYKDRFAACAVADMIQRRAKACFATSSGNTGSALAAYCAAAGIPCYLAIVDGAPSGKLQQMRIYGAETLMVKNFGKDPGVSEEVFTGLKALAEAAGTTVQISAFQYSPVGMAGVQTLAYEIAEELSPADHVFVPAGGGGLTLAAARGFRQWAALHADYHPPKVHCVQPEGNNTIAGPLREGAQAARAVPRSRTLVSGLQVPNVIDGNEVIDACRALGGTGVIVEDRQVFSVQQDLARMEGVFCEPAGAVALAGALQAVKNGDIGADERIVCLVTGHGFKDPPSAEAMAARTMDNYFHTAEETFRYMRAQITQSP